MPSVGDKVRVLPTKSGQPPRDGVVTGVSGNMLRVRWTTGEETSLIPGPGSVTILGKVRPSSGTTAKTSGASAKAAKAAKAAKSAAKETARGSGSTKSSKARKK